MLLLEKTCIVNRPVRPAPKVSFWTSYDANVIGGALVGIGMALSGACPGTVLVQIVRGIPSANATAIGCFMGAAVYVQTRDRLELMAHPQKDANQSSCKGTISEVICISDTILYPIFGLMIMGVLFFTRAKDISSLVPPMVGGLLIGSAQALSLLLTSSPLGVSTMYEHVSQNVVQAFTEKLGKQDWLTRPIAFSVGIIVGSTLLLQMASATNSSSADATISTWHAFAGGFVMTFGARFGGGCTSGHGLSGLSAMSFSSLVTVGSMFSAGILTRKLI